MQHVFISHSNRDDIFVDQLAADLRAVEVQTWVDHENIPPGANWDREVEKALKQCDILIVVLSSSAVESENVTDEWSYFLEEKKPVYPVIYEACEVPFRLRRRQRIDFTGSEGLEELYRALGVETSVLPQSVQVENVRLPFEPETVLVPAGPFLMGSTAEQIATLKKQVSSDLWFPLDEELPQHVVALPEYRVGKYPVIVGEYRAFIEAGGYHENRYWTQAGRIWREKWNITYPYLWNAAQWTEDDRLPVIGVSWFETIAYCSWLAEVTERAYRLPSEAEWEKAARGPDGLIYPWGNTFAADNTVYGGNSGGHTVVVGSRPGGQSWVGALDMCGNVWEWVNSMFKPYPYTTFDNRESNKGSSHSRILRGGAWNLNDLNVRAAVRNSDHPTLQDFKAGFRVCL